MLNLNIELTGNIAEDTNALLFDLMESEHKPQETDIEFLEYLHNLTNIPMDQIPVIGYSSFGIEEIDHFNNLINEYILDNWDCLDATYTITTINAIRYIIDVLILPEDIGMKHRMILGHIASELEELLEIYAELI